MIRFSMLFIVVLLVGCTTKEYRIINPHQEVEISKEQKQDYIERGDPVPVYRAAPLTPTEALANKIGGYVILTFDIKKDGSTDNIQVIESDPEGLFEESAIAAMKKWRYQPTDKPYLNQKQKLSYQFAE